MNITQKLKLIQEGYSAEDINSGKVSFKSLITENVKFSVFDSICKDMQFISEASNMLITENSHKNTIIETIKKVWQWIKRKFMDMIMQFKLAIGIAKGDVTKYEHLEKYIHDDFQIVIPDSYKNILNHTNTNDLSEDIKKVMDDMETLYNRLVRDNDLKIRLNNEMQNVNIENLKQFFLFNSLGVHNINQVRGRIFGEGPSKNTINAQMARAIFKNFNEGTKKLEDSQSFINDFISKTESKINQFETDMKQKTGSDSYSAATHALNCILSASSSIMMELLSIEYDVIKEYHIYISHIGVALGVAPAN